MAQSQPMQSLTQVQQNIQPIQSLIQVQQNLSNNMDLMQYLTHDDASFTEFCKIKKHISVS